MKIFHVQLCCEFFPPSPHRAGNVISTGKETFSSPLSCAFSRKEKKISTKLEEGKAH